MKEPKQQAEACVIWMHGLGADASDMAGIAEELPLEGLALRHVFIDAPVRPVTLNGGMPMLAWYDIIGLELSDREDREGIQASEAIISQVVDAQLKDGFAPEKIFLAGFSQGGAMALYTGLHKKGPLGGIICLSGYLPLAQSVEPVLAKTTPVFIATGAYDPMVKPSWTKAVVDWLAIKGYQDLTQHVYPMEHSVCLAEINDLALWLKKQVQGAKA